MTSIIHNFKSKYSLQNVFDYLPYKTSLILAKGSRYLSKCLDITLENYKKFYEIKKIIKPSYDINKYFSYFDIKNGEDSNSNCLNTYEKKEKEKILYGCLNDAPFNMTLLIGENGWEYIVQNIKKINLVISPAIISNIFDKEINQNYFDLLNIYRNNIKEISISNFSKNDIINLETINKIINIIEKIFRVQKEDRNDNELNGIDNDNLNIINVNEINNNNHNVNKISFENCSMVENIDITNKFLDKIDNIISLKKIEEIIIDSNNFNEHQFNDIMNYLRKKMNLLKSLKVNGFGSLNSHYADLDFICNNINERIEVIDLSDSFCKPSLISIFNNKRHPLREIKIKLLSNKSDSNWNFLNKSINTLEIFEIEIKEAKNANLINLIKLLNEMKKLKTLKIVGGLEFHELICFRNFETMENLNICFDNNFICIDNEDIEYFSYFHNLKSLEISSKKMPAFTFILPNFKVPKKLSRISFTNIKGENIVKMLADNLKNLSLLEELKLDDVEFNEFDFINLVKLFSSFKYLIKLSLNRIRLTKDSIYKYIPSVFKNIPSIMQLDISNNQYDSDIINSKLFENIKLALPKKLMSLKIFNNDIGISQKDIDHIKTTFGSVIDLENNSPKLDLRSALFDFIKSSLLESDDEGDLDYFDDADEEMDF
jgi:hypothetical protein